MKPLSSLDLTPFRPQLPTESTETYTALRKEHLTAERLLKIPLIENRFKEGIEDYTPCKYISYTLREVATILKEKVQDNINTYNLKSSKLLDYCKIATKIDYDKSQITFTLTWSGYYIPETITTFTITVNL